MIKSPALQDSENFCFKILPFVSRTFALNISFLKGEVHLAVVISYLMCRLADTFEDNTYLDKKTKKDLLIYFPDLLKQKSVNEKDLSPLKKPFQNIKEHASYKELVFNSEKVFDCYFHLSKPFQKTIYNCVKEMCEGMIETLEQTSQNGFYLSNIKDLDDYCYYVAGTVGVFLTESFFIHSRYISEKTKDQMKEKEVSFGLGLQITNIVKDSYSDYKRGTCYIPLDLIKKYDIPTKSFFDKDYNSKSILVFNDLIDKALSHLDDAIAYTLLIPRRERGLRIFCLLPIFFAIKTLLLAKNNHDLLLEKNVVKVTRWTILSTIIKIRLFYWSNTWIKITYHNLRRKCDFLKTVR